MWQRADRPGLSGRAGRRLFPRWRSAPRGKAARASAAPRHDIQGLLLHGYAHLPEGAFLFARIVDAARARTWLRARLPEVTPANEKRSPSLNLAFTAEGLAALGLSRDALASFPREFREGMLRRADVLGDTGESAAPRWHFGGRPDALHLVLMVYADSACERLVARHRRLLREGGLELVYCQRVSRQAAKLPGDGPDVVREPFGFRDGLSQPAIEGFSRDTGCVVPALDQPVKPGEFILGHPNEYGELPDSPSVAGPEDPRGALPDSPVPGRKDLGRNGSYLVLRKLEQDVAAFHRFLDANTRDPDGRVDPARRDWLAAKLLGRWPNGAPLRPGQEHAPPAGANPDNRFLYAEADPAGLGCPVTSHVRRANPRDSLAPSGKHTLEQAGPTPEDRERSLRLTRHHRLLRRGIPYADGARKGIVFLALNANLRRQFEFIQQTWLNNGKFGGMGDQVDPVVGGGEGPGERTFTVPCPPLRQRFGGLSRLVRTRGGAYFFLPSLTALAYLAGATPARH